MNHDPTTPGTLHLSEAEWRRRLTPEQFRICRLKGTERAFTGHLWDCKDPGTYQCAACGSELFDSGTKFESGSGWPSFFDVLDASRVRITEDRSHGMIRLEVTCARCGSHLGHVFDDGPRPSGKRYCINSASLELDRREET
jgi:peptide-methionine (R)-S-oxide reductase